MQSLWKNRLRKVLPLQTVKSSMNPTEGFPAQCQFPKHPSTKPCHIKLDPKRDIKGQPPMRYSIADPGSKGQWWSSLTERAIFQSSLQLVYSLSYFDTTPVSVLAWKPPQHSRWQSVCITNVLQGHLWKWLRGLLQVGQEGRQGPSPGAAAQPSVPDFAGETSHPVKAE